MKFNIVGLQHHNLPNDFVTRLEPSSIIFEREPKNLHDKNAIKCISKNCHFGYVEKDKARLLTNLILTSKNIYKIKIIKRDTHKVEVEVNFLNKNLLKDLKLSEKGKFSGIYQIKFRIESNFYYYIGQSLDINKRLKQHSKNLEEQNHHNITMQCSWIEDSSSFSCQILYQAKNETSPLQKQIELFEKELYYIAEKGSSSVNAIDGDLVFTKEAVGEFEAMNKVFAKRVGELRKVKVYQKEKLGKLILDVGIFDRNQPRGINIKETNVLSWLNKKPHSVFDYIPRQRTDVVGYSELVKAIRNLQEKISQIDVDKGFVGRFKDSLFKKKGSFETCNFKELNLYLTTLGDYREDIKSKDIISGYKTLSNGKITLDSSLFELLDKNIINQLKEYKD